jgi:large subunit ribosomal protein L29
MKGETKIATMADWTLEERAAKEKEWRQALFTLRLQKATGQLDNPMKIKSLRREIARLKTLSSQNAPGAPVASSPSVAAPAATAETKAPKAEPAKKPAAKKAPKAPAAKPAAKAKPTAKAKA